MPDLLTAYLNHLGVGAGKGYESAARGFCKWLGDREPTRRVIDAWLRRRVREGYALGSVKHSFGVIRTIFTVNGMEKDWPYRKGEGPQVGERDEYRPSIEDHIGVMIRASETLTAQHRAFLALSTTYGVRRGEIQEMGTHSFDWESHLVYVKTEKRGRERYHMIPDEILPHLQAYDWHRVSLSGVSLRFVELKAAAGFTHAAGREIGWHAIRRAIDGILMDAGWSEFHVNKFLRWKTSSQSMAQRYASRTVVSPDGTRVEVGIADAEIDQRAFELLPWLSTWTEVPTTK